MGTIPVDDLLRQYVECEDAAHADSLLAELVIQHAQPGIRKVVLYKLAFQGQGESQDVEDVAGDVMVALIARLQGMRSGASDDGIGSFAGYTAVAAYHACHEYLRRKYPNRHRLKTRLRYLLNAEKPLAVWEASAGEWVCGFQRWQNAGIAPAAAESVGHWRDTLSDLPRGTGAMHPGELLSKLFQHFSGPVEFDELVNMMAHIWGVDDPPPASEKTAREVASGEADPTHRMELQRWLAELWRQIRDLPRGQRVALLMNLRAGDSTPALTMLPLTGIAGIREIAEALEIATDEFAALWNKLPLEDLAIADLLGVTRQQVINLRKSARERLTRRIGGKYRLS
ncbi:MAG: hypothetical protein ABI806_14145 [Candidatus Solibacter sp.]